MTDLIYKYLNLLLHPVKIHTDLHDRRVEIKRMKEGRLFALVEENYKVQGDLEFTSMALISWLFVLFFGIYSLVFLHLGSYLSESVMDSGILPGFVVGSLFQKKLLLIVTLFEVVFFPVAAWIYVKFWRVLIVFFSNLFVKEVDDKSLDDVVNTSLVGNFFLIIPVLGKFLKSISSIFYIFWGLKHNLRFTTTQSLIVIISPVIISSMFLLLIAMYVMLVINLF